MKGRGSKTGQERWPGKAPCARRAKLRRRAPWGEPCGLKERTAVAGLTFELTPTAEAGVVSLVRDDATAGTYRAYNACRSGSGAERGVRPHATGLK